jgi:hypothetical protein
MKSISVGQLKPGQKLATPNINTPKRMMTRRPDTPYDGWEVAGRPCELCGREISKKDENKHAYGFLGDQYGDGHPVHISCEIKYLTFRDDDPLTEKELK